MLLFLLRAILAEGQVVGGIFGKLVQGSLGIFELSLCF